MDAGLVKRLIEALVLISGNPLAFKRLKEALAETEPSAIRGMIEQLNTEYAHTGRAFRIQEVAGGYQVVTEPELAPWLKRAFQLPREDTLSKAAMETLAIIAYRQPLTKAEIEIIRGVDVTGTIERLLEREMIKVVGRKETPGRPILYGTTEEFLRHFGLASLKHLPPMNDAASPSAEAIPLVLLERKETPEAPAVSASPVNSSSAA